MKLKNYQLKSVKELLYYAQGCLEGSLNKSEIVFKAPTGAGKTVVASKLIEELLGEKTTFLWFAPRQLHGQTAEKMESILPGATIKQVGKDQLGDSLLPRQVVLSNWESVNRKTNKSRKTTDTTLAFEEISKNTSELGRKIIVFIDEAHYALGNKKDITKARELIDELDKDLIISITATPNTKADVEVKLQEVREEQMIRKEILLNPKDAFQEALNNDSDDGASITEDETFEAAFKFRESLATQYKKEDIGVNPLMLIQVAGKNDTDRTTSKDYAIAQLAKLGADQASGRVAVWLSDEKPKDLEEVYAKDGNVDYLIFKQAISLGWDCPRAQVLLKLRDASVKSESFEIQTVGRIMRMPEQRYYNNDDFNTGFVFHRSKDYKISSELEGVVNDTKTVIKPEVEQFLKNITIPATFYKRTEVDSPSDSDIKAVIIKFLEEIGFEHRGLVARKMRSRVPEDKAKENKLKLTQLGFNLNSEDAKGTLSLDDRYDGNSEGEVDEGEKHQRSLSAGEHKRKLIEVIQNIYGGNCFSESQETLEKISIQLKSALNISSIAKVHTLLSSDNNIKEFERIIRKAIESEASYTSRAKRVKINYEWQIPKEEWKLKRTGEKIVNAKSNAKKYSHIDCYLSADSEQRHKETEQVFEAELEADPEVDWWWKNGDNAPTANEADKTITDIGPKETNLSIGFEIFNEEIGTELRNFLPDYVYSKNGALYVVEVKSWHYGFDKDQVDAKGVKTAEINKHKLAALEEWRKQLAAKSTEIKTGFWIRNSNEQGAVFIHKLEDLSDNWESMDSYNSPRVN